MPKVVLLALAFDNINIFLVLVSFSLTNPRNG